MKSTNWISNKLKLTLFEIQKLEEQIKERNIEFEDLKNHKLIIDGEESSLTLNESLTTFHNVL